MHNTRVAFTTQSSDLEENAQATDLCYEFIEGNSTDFVIHVVRFMRAMGYDDAVIVSGINGAAEELGWRQDPAHAD